MINSLLFSVHKISWRNEIRFSVYDPDSPTQHCNSCLLFNDADKTISCGFLAAIVFYPIEEYRRVISKVYTNRRDSLICNGRYIINSFIFWRHLMDFPQLVTIPF